MSTVTRNSGGVKNAATSATDRADQRQPLGAFRRKDRLPTRPRSFGMIAAGGVLMLVTALLGTLLYMQAGQATSVLAVRDPVAKGEKVDRDNLISKQVSGVAAAVRVDDVQSVVGKTATVDLLAGQIVTAPAVTDDPVPGSGRAVVGLALTPSQMPGSGIGPGDLVRVVAVPAKDESGATLDEAPTLAASAQVLSVSDGGSAEVGRIVTVVASDSEADRLATFSAAGRLAVVKISTPGSR